VELDLFSHWKRETYDILSRADQYVGGESEKKNASLLFHAVAAKEE
jgi:hypothetical protein